MGEKRFFFTTRIIFFNRKFLLDNKSAILLYIKVKGVLMIDIKLTS